MIRTLSLVASTALAASVGLTALTAAPAAGQNEPSGEPPATAQPDARAYAVTQARQAVAAHPDAALLSDQEELEVVDVVTDRDGSTHVRFSRVYQGLPVVGTHLIVHNGPSGELRGMTTNMGRPIDVPTDPRVTREQARTLAEGRFEGSLDETKGPRLLVDASERPRLAWETVVTGTRPDGQTPSELHVLVDAREGHVFDAWNEVYTAEGSGTGHYDGQVTVHTTQSGGGYEMRDPQYGGGVTVDMNNRRSGGQVFTSSDNVWDDGAGVDAHYGARETYSFYEDNYDYSGYDGSGSGVTSRVHYGSNVANAFYQNGTVTYGDGRGPFTQLDVVGHEISHGVTASTAGLRYSGDAGGLNESTSDIFGTLVEFSASNPNDQPDYTMGEKIFSGALRYLYDPNRDGQSDSCYDSGTGGKDPHHSSGVGNHFFYLLAQGSSSTDYPSSPTCDGSSVEGIGNAKAGAIWFRALSRYMGPSETYPQAASATLSAATDLYGECSTAYQAVQAAWSGASVDAGGQPCDGGEDPPPEEPPEDPGTWEAGTSYQAGDQVTYDGQTYECVQAHTAYAGWEPPNAPALWQPV